MRYTTTILITSALVASCGSASTDEAAVPGVGADSPATPISVIEVTTTVDEPAATSAPTTTAPSTDTSTSPAPTSPAPTSTAPTSAPPGTAAPTATDDAVYLRQGDEGPRIATMQRELAALEYLAPNTDSGVFDGATNSALIQFQGDYGLIVDGVFGPETDRALTAAAQSVTSGG